MFPCHLCILSVLASSPQTFFKVSHYEKIYSQPKASEHGASYKLFFDLTNTARADLFPLLT